MHTVEFDPAIEAELTRQAAIVGRPVDTLIAEAVREYLEDMGDIAEAEAVLARIKAGRESVEPWERVKTRHGL